jgi:hypothetical protein
MNSASLCSLAGRYDNPIPPRFLVPIDFLKIPALDDQNARPVPPPPPKIKEQRTYNWTIKMPWPVPPPPSIKGTKNIKLDDQNAPTRAAAAFDKGTKNI